MVALTRVVDRLSRLKSGDGVEFSFRDTGASKISEQMDILNGHVITIGFQGSTALVKYPGGPNVATVAMFNEFGTENAPERQFMRRTASANRQKIRVESARLLGQVAMLKLDAMAALDQLGRFVAEAMSAQIDQSKRWAEPNMLSTVLSKGGDQPLVDTGLMQESITWAIRKGSEIGPIVKEGRL